MRLFSSGWSEGFDGPGRRWILYLKGCNLRCRWCTNPEGISAGPQVLFYPNRGREPEQACARRAIRSDAGGYRLDRRMCDGCPDHPCVAKWGHPAFELAWSEVTPAQVVERSLRYRLLFGQAGGVTFGGGEATLQAAEVAESLERLRYEGIHTVVETNAAAAGFEEVRTRAQLLVCDLKCIERERHRAWTGVDNDVILENLRTAAAEQPEMWVRVPFVTGMNDTDEEMDRLSTFLAELHSLRTKSRDHAFVVEVLPLHAGEPKYRAIGREYPMAGIPSPSAEKVNTMLRRLRLAGVATRLAGRRYEGRTR
jgi:pyruvate formate lyase activating enzyme